MQKIVLQEIFKERYEDMTDWVGFERKEKKDKYNIINKRKTGHVTAEWPKLETNDVIIIR